MELADLTKDVQRLLLTHWNEGELSERLQDPDYFFEQVVIPRLDYLRRQGDDAPRLRFSRSPAGEPRIVLVPHR